MTDSLTAAERSERMALIHGRDTKPEMKVRRLVHGMGFRYRLHRRDLPGVPDLVFPSRRKVIFVHGCFWHQHARCTQYRQPKTKLDFWEPKLRENKLRDARHRKALTRLGWESLVVWECQLKRLDRLAARLQRFLEGSQ